MTKKVLFLSAAVLLLAAGCSKSAPQPSASATPPASSAAQSPTSLKTLMMAGGAKQCTVNLDENGNQSQGNIYIANGMVRGDFTAQIKGQAQTSHMINDGTNIYTWLDGMPTGFKMAVMAMATSTAMSSSSTQDSMHKPGIDPNVQENYNCSAWNVDSSVFTPPTSVNFSNMMQMQNGAVIHGSAGAGAMMTPPSGSSNAQACSACNPLTGSQKAECLAALKCN